MKFTNWDNYLFDATKGVLDDFYGGDCNPDLAPLVLADACEIGFNKGFTTALQIVGVTLAGITVGVGSVYFIKRRKEKTKK